MKITKRFLSVTGLLAMLLMAGNVDAQNRNDILFSQSISQDYFDGTDEALMGFYDDWRESGVRKIRTQQGEDTPGTYRSLIEFDSRGNIARVETENGQTHTASYDRSGNLRRVYTYQSGDLYATEYFFYSRSGDLKRSTIKFKNGEKELERFFDENYRLARQRKYQNGIASQTLSFQWNYDEDGKLKSMTGPGRRANLYYEGDKLTQVRESSGGTIEQVNLVYGDKGIQKVKKYVEKNDDLILSSVIALEYNNAGIVARMKEQGRDKNVLADVTNFYYDSFNKDALAHRGEWDGGGYGYGTPVIIEWDTPDYDRLVIDSTTTLKLKLRPGVNQNMPDITEMTLRLNHKNTKREIGHVVLKRKGDDWYVEEDLPLLEGKNTVFLEVQTDLGRFSSGERYITYKNPNRQIDVQDLHILAIGVEDYQADRFDLEHTSDDINFVVERLEKQEGKLFGDVRTTLLVDSDATKQNIEDAMRKIRGQAAADDIVLIYFSGHGEEMHGQFYLKPHDVADSRTDLVETSIDNQWMLEEISRYDASTLYFLDASHEMKVQDDEADIGIANMDMVKSDFEEFIGTDEEIRIFMSSTSTKQKVIRGEDGISHFATAMIEGIEGKADATGNANGYVTVNELSDYVSDRVLGMTSWKQKPAMVKRGIGLVPVAKVTE